MLTDAVFLTADVKKLWLQRLPVVCLLTFSPQSADYNRQSPRKTKGMVNDPALISIWSEKDYCMNRLAAANPSILKPMMMNHRWDVEAAFLNAQSDNSFRFETWHAQHLLFSEKARLTTS